MTKDNRDRRVRISVALSFATAFLLASAPGAAQVLRQDFPVTDGRVEALAVSGSTLYLGGYFSRIGPPTGGGVPTDPATGDLLPAFPKAAGVVHAVIPDGGGGWYIGGDFLTVGGVTHPYLARILPDLTVSDWDPKLNGAILAMVLEGSTIFIGGEFTQVGDQVRPHIASINVATGLASDWNPYADNVVAAIALSPSVVYVGGSFVHIGGEERRGIAALERTTSSATEWNPNAANGSVSSIVVDGATVYVGGAFYSIGGALRDNLAAIDATTGAATAWDPSPDQDVNALALGGLRLYVGGWFTAIGGEARNRLAAIDLATGTTTSWNPELTGYGSIRDILVSGSTIYVAGTFGYIGGQPRVSVAALDASTGMATSWNVRPNDSANCVAATGASVYVGGAFTSVGGVSRNGIAAVDIPSGTVTDWDPNSNGSVSALALGEGIIYVGGSFTEIGGQPRQSIAALDVGTGLATPWNPGANDRVRSLLKSGPTLYAAGWFTHIGGEARNYIAAVDAGSGLATAWNPNSDRPVYTLALRGSTIYAGGFFANIGGQGRRCAAALDSLTGLAGPWSPDPHNVYGPDEEVNALKVSGSSVYVGGNYNAIDGIGPFISDISAVDAVTGGWNGFDSSAGGEVLSLDLGAGLVYAGGYFRHIGGQDRDYIATLDAVTGLATDWAPHPDNSVSTVLVSGVGVYAGGDFRSVDGQPQSHLVAFTSVPTSIALSLVSAEMSPGRVRLTWRYEGESSVTGKLYRRIPWSGWELIGAPNIDPDGSIAFDDVSIVDGATYDYRLTIEDGNSRVQSVENSVNVPRVASALRLEALHPNPFRGVGRLSYSIPQSGDVTLAIYGITGRLVTTLVDRIETAGSHSIEWNGRNGAGVEVGSGLYYARLTARGQVRTAKIVILR